MRLPSPPQLKMHTAAMIFHNQWLIIRTTVARIRVFLTTFETAREIHASELPFFSGTLFANFQW